MYLIVQIGVNAKLMNNIFMDAAHNTMPSIIVNLSVETESWLWTWLKMIVEAKIWRAVAKVIIIIEVQSFLNIILIFRLYI